MKYPFKYSFHTASGFFALAGFARSEVLQGRWVGALGMQGALLGMHSRGWVLRVLWACNLRCSRGLNSRFGPNLNS